MARSLLEKLRALEQTARSRGNFSSANSDSPASKGAGEQVSVEPLEISSSDMDPRVAADRQLEQAGFEQLQTPYGSCWRRQTTFDLVTRHGHHRFLDILSTDLSSLSQVAGVELRPENLRFYDVETNGLGTGAGTFPFLHTIAYIEEDELSLMQYFVDDYSAEEAVLDALCQAHFPDGTIIVTFNGKTFDWPLLQNRRVIHQMERLERPQVDLLHPARKLWRTQLPSVKLAQLEVAILGVTREDDLPGSEAPKRYFEYLDNRDAALIEPVLGHNLMDVCSLVTLQVEIAKMLNGEHRATHADTHLALATWYDAWHDVQAASSAYHAAYLAQDAHFRSHWLYSLFLKRRKEYEAASALWRDMTVSFPERVEPFIELAKYYEHRERNFEAAERVVREALDRIHGSEVGRKVTIPHRVERSSSPIAKVEPIAPVESSVSALEQALLHRLQRIVQKKVRLSQ